MGVMMDLPVVQQATIWSQREHCARTVAKHLLRLDYPADLLHRVWVVNGSANIDDLTGRLPGLPPTVHRSDVRVYPQIVDATLRERKKEAICMAWADLLGMLDKSHDVLMVEDDIVVPPQALKRLQRTAYERDALIVSALTMADDGHLPFFAATERTVLKLHGIPDQPIEVACGGTFCCYVRADAFRLLADLDYRPTWEPSDCKHSRGLIGKDCHLWLTLYDAGAKLMLDPGVRVDHWVLRGPNNLVVYHGDPAAGAR